MLLPNVLYMTPHYHIYSIIILIDPQYSRECVYIILATSDTLLK